MNPLREALLWASQNDQLKRTLPRYRFVRSTVARFMPGDTVDAALEAAGKLGARGLPTTFTYLGENVTTRAQAEAAQREYLDVLNRIQVRGLNSELSVKPTQFGYEVEQRPTLAILEHLATRSTELGRHLWIDMESSAYVERTLLIYEQLRKRFPATGICLQAYLHRSPRDVESVLSWGGSIRLVKGAYREPRDVAERDRQAIREMYYEMALTILRSKPSGARLVLGTHDVDLVLRIDKAARDEGIGRDAYEVHMLYGIRVADQFQLAMKGYRVRTLISYGPQWFPWFMRRMAERPVENSWLALRNLLARTEQDSRQE